MNPKDYDILIWRDTQVLEFHLPVVLSTPEGYKQVRSNGPGEDELTESQLNALGLRLVNLCKDLEGVKDICAYPKTLMIYFEIGRELDRLEQQVLEAIVDIFDLIPATV